MLKLGVGACDELADSLSSTASAGSSVEPDLADALGEFSTDTEEDDVVDMDCVVGLVLRGGTPPR
jgi:hypothetical protein